MQLTHSDIFETNPLENLIDFKNLQKKLSSHL